MFQGVLGSEKECGGVSSRGESIFAHDIGGSVLQRWGVAVAASLAGELRGAASPLHKKRRGMALEVRLDARKEMEG